MNIWHTIHISTTCSPTTTQHLTYMHSPTISPSISIYAVVNNNCIITPQQLHTISQYSSKRESTPIYDIIIFHTQKSFTYLHKIILSYAQKIRKVFDLKDYFRQSSYCFVKRPIMTLFKAKQLIRVWKSTIQS